MDNFGIEGFDRFRHPRVMTPEKWIVPQVFIEIERQRSAGELEMCGRLFLRLPGLARAPDAEEGIAAPLREGRSTGGW